MWNCNNFIITNLPSSRTSNIAFLRRQMRLQQRKLLFFQILSKFHSFELHICSIARTLVPPGPFPEDVYIINNKYGKQMFSKFGWFSFHFQNQKLHFVYQILHRPFIAYFFLKLSSHKKIIITSLENLIILKKVLIWKKLRCKDNVPRIWNLFSQKWNCEASFLHSWISEIHDVKIRNEASQFHFWKYINRSSLQFIILAIFT